MAPSGREPRSAPTLEPAAIARLAELASLVPPAEDLEALAEALAAHAALVAPLLKRLGSKTPAPARAFDPRWDT